MTQTVFSNDMVAHVWAQQTQPFGRSNNGNFYFEGPNLYSYGTHYPVGIFTRSGRVFLNSTSSTPTTEGKHKNAARRALPDYGRDALRLPDLDDVADLLNRTDESGRLPVADRAAWAGRVARYLESGWRSIPADSGGAAFLLEAIGSRATWEAMRARFEAKADREAEAKAARLKAGNVRHGRDVAARPLLEMRETAWLEADSYGQRELRDSVKDIRAARLATPKAHKRVRSALWERETALRAILASAEADSDRHGNPGDRTKARGLLAKLRRFRDGRVGHVPGFDGPDGPDKRQAALDLPTGAGWRTLANLLNGLAVLGVHVPTATREAAERLYTKADGIATRLEGEETQRREIADAKRRVLAELRTFNAGRRHYRRLVADGSWAGDREAESYPGGPVAPMTDRQRARALDSILAHVPSRSPWGTERGFQLRPDLAAKAARIAEAAERHAAELEPIRDRLRSEAERRAAEAAKAEREREERLALMSPDELREAWEAGELPRGNRHLAALERDSGPLLRAIGAEIDGCTVKGGTLETSQGATVPLRHAFRVFQFVSACRAEGKAWTPGAWGPARIRVGHFALDRVDSSGTFKAGCHTIQWAEIARLADRLGVAGCLVPLPEAAAELEGEAA